MSYALYWMGRWSARRPWSVLGAWMLVAVVVIGTASAFGGELEDTFEVPGLDSQIAVDLLSEAASDRAGLTAQIVVTPLDADATFFDDAAAVEAVAEVQAAVAELPNVVATSDPAGAIAAGPEAAVGAGAVSADGRVAVVAMQYPVMEELGVEDLERLKETVAELRTEVPLQVESRGELYFAFEEAETGTGELIGLAAAVVILLVAFGSLIAMGLPIGIALFGLAVGVSSLSLITYVIDIPSWAPQLATMVGLGVGIDYALFLVTRHREHLAKGMAMDEAIGRAVATAGQAVVFAGGTVVIAILGLAVAGVPFLTAAGIATSVVVAIMVLASITLLPAFLGLAGDRINGLRRSRREAVVARAAAPTGDGGGGVGAGWERWGRHVSRNAWTYAIGVTALLLALTAPVLALRLGFPDEGTLPESRSERRAYDLVADGFGPGVNGPLLIAVDLSSGSSSDPEVLVAELASAVGADPGVVATAPPEIDPTGAVATIVAFPTTAPQDDDTLETVQRLRAEVFPEVLAGEPVTAHVGGQTANVADVGDRINERLPLFIAAVIVLSFLLLTVLFRSLLVPLKAAVLNLLSIGAAYGVLVMVFQWGWGASLIGLETTVPVVSFIPMFMFAILFGLSMDYEVFLLSRVREEYDATGDNETSVIRGIAGTARVITSAALIMIAVFSGFVLGDDPTIKMFGLGLATAILVDATVVRIILVPATMKLMGDANWWLPGWLDRVLPSIDHDGAGLDVPPGDARADGGGGDGRGGDDGGHDVIRPDADGGSELFDRPDPVGVG
ncbi:MAG: MMPL family transporter [Actinomycetota bacterium]